jgi:hypothetical protein
MEALAELFPRKSASVMVRQIVSRFIDKARDIPEQPVKTDDINL